MIDAREYGKALFELSRENKTDDAVRRELLCVRELLHKHPEYVTLMDTPAVSSREKHALLQEAFCEMDEMLRNFLSILCDKRSFFRFDACVDAFCDAFDEANGILRATAVSAVELKPSQCEALRGKLSSLTGKHIELTNRVDPTVLGGVVLRYAGVQIDDSLRTRLETLRRSLAETIV